MPKPNVRVCWALGNTTQHAHLEVKPHIILVGPAYPYRGGIASFIHRLGEEYRKHDYTVEIITFTLQYPGFLFPGTSQYNTGPNPTTIPIRRMIHALNPLSWIRTGLYIRKKKATRVLINYWLPFFGFCFAVIARLAKRSGITTITGIVHNIIPHEKRPFDQAFTRLFVRATDDFVVMSRSVEEQMRLFTKTKPVRYHPHPIYDNYGDPVDRNTALAAIHLDADYRYILYFGFIRKYKGLDLLIQAMKDPYFWQNKIRLLIAGEYYEPREEYQALIQSLPHPEVVVEHTEFIPDDHVKYYFSAVNLVAQPYRSATQSGISQLAIFFEKPMVVTRVGGLPEIIGDRQGGLVVDTNPVSIGDAMKIYFEENHQADFTRHIQSIKPHYSWSAFFECIERPGTVSSKSKP